MQRLKVLFITPWYPHRQQTMAGTSIREHAKAMSRYHDVVVLHCLRALPGDHFKGLWRIEQDTDEELTQGVPTYRAWYKRLLLPKTGAPAYLLSTLQAVRRLVAVGFRPDIIQAHIFGVGVHSLVLSKMYSVPFVMTEHSALFYERKLTWLDLQQVRLGYGAASVVVPVSHSLERAIKAYGIRARYRMLPNATDMAQFSPPAARPFGTPVKRILFVGRQVPGKGVDTLLEALHRVEQRRGDWVADIVGEGPQRSEYEAMASDLALNAKVTFHGNVPHTSVAEMMRESDFLAHPTLGENCPCVVVEAMATGLPVLSTRVEGVPETVAGGLHMLVPPSDPDALAQAIDSMLDRCREWTPADYATAVEHTRRRFGHEAIGSEYDALYRHTIAERNPHLQPARSAR
jgi:L-malate glycosyltransferase